MNDGGGTLAGRALLVRFGDLDETGAPGWDDPDLLLEVARAHSAAGNAAKVERFLARCADLRPARAALYFGQLGWHFQKAKRWARAVGAYDRALETFPGYHLALFRRGYCLERLHRPRAAVRSLEEACRAYAALPESQRERSAGIQAQVLFHLARSLREIGETDRSRQVLDDCASIAGDHNPVVKPEHILASEASAHMADGNHDRAVEMLERARIIDPGSPVILERLGNALAALGRTAEAEEVLRAAVALPKGAVALISLARHQSNNGQIHAAAQSLAESLRRHPQGEIQVRLELADLQRRIGRPAAARALLLRLAGGRVPAGSSLAVAVHSRIAAIAGENGRVHEANHHRALALRHDRDDGSSAADAPAPPASAEDPPLADDGPIPEGLESLLGDQSSRRGGSVGAWFPDRGFGFIVPDGEDRTVFFHVSHLAPDGAAQLAVGDRVTFTVMLNPRTGRTQAEEVVVEAAGERPSAVTPRA